LKERKEHIEYVFRVRDGPPFTERELDDLERLLAAMIIQNLGYKKETTNVSKEEDQV
jgi:hypothetical protein